MKRKILFMAEAVTLAHVSRPIVLARSLPSDKYTVMMACSPRYANFLINEPVELFTLSSISVEHFTKALERGRPAYDLATLRRYVHDDLSLIDRTKPDLIVGDFRLSLSVSCRLAGVPYAAITNAYWSPFCERKDYPLPVLPLTRFLPISTAKAVFSVVGSAAMAFHCRALNQLRSENGLPTLENNLRSVYTDSDHTLYADAPSMFPATRCPASHHFLGPILWSPDGAEPAWWNDIPAEKPIIYVTLGSSGAVAVLNRVIDALSDAPVTVMASGAGAADIAVSGANSYVSSYLPGTQAAARSQVVVCNGGSPTCYQALAAGVPILGIASNMDQFLNMQGVVNAGAGLLMRADRLTRSEIRSAVERLLHEEHFKNHAVRSLGEYSPAGTAGRFAAWVDGARDQQ